MKITKPALLTAAPVGRRIVFTADGELWMAFPLSKTARLHAHAARLFGITHTARTDLTAVVADRPDLYPLLRPVLATLAHADVVPTWCHDRADAPRPPAAAWRKELRAWAATHDTERAVIRQPRTPSRELTIASVIARIRKHVGPMVPLTVTAEGSDTVTVRYLDGRVVAHLAVPV